MDPVQKLLATGKYSRKDLASIYRYLCKHTHPDTAGGDGSVFLKVREAYAKALEKFEEAKREKADLDFDPDAIPRELGYPAAGGPRGSLLACLRFYHLLGLQSLKVRSNPALRERNARVMKSVVYWAKLYDEGFAEVFSDFNRQAIQPMASTREMKDYAFARRTFSSGLAWFFRFQETGRESSRRISREKFSSAVYTFEKFLGRPDPSIAFARWLLAELEAPAVLNRDPAAKASPGE